MAEHSVDAFLLYNEQDAAKIALIASGLESHGVSTHYWDRDVGYGDAVSALEQKRFADARVVLVFLGDAGWGPTQLSMANEALHLNRLLIPVLIGEPPAAAFEEAKELFREKRRADLRTLHEATIRRLADQITGRDTSRGTPSLGRWDGVVRALVDGNDEERAATLERLMTYGPDDRAGLGARLRAEIRDRYTVAKQEDFMRAPRALGQVASARSWMLSALIWCDAEDAENRALLLTHLGVEEPESGIRFWILAGLYRRGTSYLPSALELARKDDAPDVADLARAIERPADDRVVDDLRMQLHSSRRREVWAVLRVLRIIAIPPLAPDVCALLDASVEEFRLRYDVLYALSNLRMTYAAVPILAERPGVNGVLSRCVAEARESIGVVQHYAVLLAAFSEQQMDRALADAANDSDTGDVVRALRSAVRRYRGGASELFIAGYDPDRIDVRDDRLDIDQDVQTLTAVMLAKDVQPPLAIGLFGDWGSGKSFFMQSMKAAAAKIASTAKASPSSKFCSDIVQIDFNAWHYADTNLWANLVSTIFEGLAEHMKLGATPEEQQTALLTELGTAKDSVERARNEKHSTENALKEQHEKLAEFKTERLEKEVTLWNLRFSDLKRLFATNPDLKKDVQGALHDVGVPAAIASVEELSKVIAQAHLVQGRAAALLVWLKKPGALLWLTFAVVASGAAFFLVQLLHQPWITSSVSAFTAAVAGVAVFTSGAVRHVSAALGHVEKLKGQVDDLITAKRQQPGPEEINVTDRIKELMAQEYAETAKIMATTEKIHDLEAKLQAIQDSLTLARFVHDRTTSDDYRKYLGLISIVRRDFEMLAKRLSQARDADAQAREAKAKGVAPAQPKPTELKPVERIILYVDDLDRCPANTVMAVLQAVHLLLAYPLFVVVVGVDPRWLVNSLQVKLHDEITPPGADTEAPMSGGKSWVTTPRDYLEKIFQIPFSVRPMTESGYAHLLSGLFAERRVDGHSEQWPVGAAPDDVPTARQATPGEAPPEAGAPPDLNKKDAPGGDSPDKPSPSKEPKRTFVINDAALTIKPWERAFAERLYPFITTPRSAKRFSNVYRILKAPVSSDDLARFEGTADLPGDFRAAMLLLAIVIGAPVQALELFPKLHERAQPGADMRDVLRHVATLGDGAAFAELQEKMLRIVGDDFPASPDPFVTWLPRVARFSFDIGRGLETSPPSGSASSPSAA